MKNKKGFTLTEILLAVMIVGLIGIALASLTRAAAREAGVGRSKIMLRNHLSSFMRTLRGDLAKASRVSYVINGATCNTGGALLLRIHTNTDQTGAKIISDQGQETILYCHKCSTAASTFPPVMPSGSYRGGTIYRKVLSSYNSSATCSSGYMTAANAVLSNVKYLPKGGGFGEGSPAFIINPYARTKDANKSMKSIIDVQLITELDSRPVVNDVIEETFAVPTGF